MKRITASLCLLCLTLAGAGAAETGFATQFGNYGLSDYDAADDKYETYFQWGTSLFYKDVAGIDDTLMYRFELERDPLSGYSLSSMLDFRADWYSLGFGPVFGIINESWSLIKPGFGGRIRGQWPGKAFIEIGGDTIPSQYTGAEDDYSRFSGYYTLGFYIRQNHILCYFTQSLENYSNLTDLYTDKYVGYVFYTDFYDKTSMFKMQTRIGYEILSKTFADGSDIELQNILFGLQADFFINARATVFIGIDNKIYPGTYGDIELDSVPLYLVTVDSGFRWSF